MHRVNQRSNMVDLTRHAPMSSFYRFYSRYHIFRLLYTSSPSSSPLFTFPSFLSHIIANLSIALTYAPHTISLDHLFHLFSAISAHPSYTSLSSRLSTFNSSNWLYTQLNYASPLSLSLSGFFYDSRHDHVACFYCGLVITSWKNTITPNHTHQSRSPGCHYVKALNRAI